MNNTNIKNKLLLVTPLIFYFLFKLIPNLSVLCASTNEGFYILFGQHYLNTGDLRSGSLFILMYSFILKVLGFGNNWVLVAIHFIQTLIVIITGVIIYLLLNMLIKDYLYSAIAVFLWIFLSTTPIGAWGQVLEFEANFALEAEYLCNLFSVFSLYLLIKAFIHVGSKYWGIIAGVLAICSLLFKISGAVLVIAIGLWSIYLFIFQKRFFLEFKDVFLNFFLGAFVSMFLLSLLFWDNIIKYFNQSLFSSCYTADYMFSFKQFLILVINLIFRGTNSLNNLLLFIVSGMALIFVFINSLQVNKTNNLISKNLLLLICIWSFGNACAVIAPGSYGSYYYILMWPSIAILLSVSLKKFVAISDRTLFPFLVFIVLFLIVGRYLVVFPGYLNILKESYYTNIFFQPNPYEYNLRINHHFLHKQNLEVAQYIRGFLSNQADKLFLFNLGEYKILDPSFYVYIKRMPGSINFSDYLYYKKDSSFVDKMIRDLEGSPPKILITPLKLIFPSTDKIIDRFIHWHARLIKNKYHLKAIININKFSDNDDGKFYIYERN